ncbi:MAG TPA: hypothetical protein VFD35_10575 [Pricia sp.]|nr:hypothetical protein [Pricia sp.]
MNSFPSCIRQTIAGGMIPVKALRDECSCMKDLSGLSEDSS